MAKTVLITAFDSFPGVPDNPTATLLATLPNCPDPRLQDVETLLLPTIYGEAPRQLSAGLGAHHRALIMLFYSAHATGVTLERYATDDCRIDRPDARGSYPLAAHSPPTRYATIVNLDALSRHLSAAGLPVEMSDDAGTYVCNHLYHAALSHCHAAPGLRALFIHFPAIEGTALAQDATASMRLRDMQKAIALTAEYLGA